MDKQAAPNWYDIYLRWFQTPESSVSKGKKERLLNPKLTRFNLTLGRTVKGGGGGGVVFACTSEG